MDNIKIVIDLTSGGGTGYHFNPVSWFLKTYHQIFSKSKDAYNWTLPYVVINECPADDILLDLEIEIITQQISILGFSHYVWTPHMLELAKKLKNKFPNLTIIFGGPELDAHKNVNFFKTHYYIDWVIYGDGEHAFGNLLDHLAGYTDLLFNVVSNPGTIYPHQVFSDKEALKKSPYLENKNEIVAVISKIKSKLSTIPNISKNAIMIWETTKGCPYGCSFCDWNSGLHNKVRIWARDELIPNWKKELDFFTEIGINNLWWTNPNVGLAAQDTDIVDYLCELRKINPKSPSVINPQLSKLNKEKSYALLDKLLNAGVSYGLKFDLQDLDYEVLKNVDRPDIPWDKHKPMIEALIAKHRHILRANGRSNRINFIWGMPGQTLEHMKNNMVEAGSLGFLANHYPLLVLPNAPVSDPDYQNKFKLRVKNVTTLLSDQELSHQALVYPCRTVVSTMSLTEKDWFTGILLFYIYLYFYDTRAGIVGQEKIFWKNYSKIQHIIDTSYEYFAKTSVVAIVTDNNPVVIYTFLRQHQNNFYKLLFCLD